LKAGLAEFDRELPGRLRTGSAELLSRERAEIVDSSVRQLFGPFGPSGLAVLATGGFGSFDLTPASDVDLLFLHRPGDRTVEDAVAAVVYPLWDAGLRVSHAVRTPEECEMESELRLESLTTMATARLVDGDPELAGEACARSVGVARRQGPAFVRAIRASRAERERRFGRVARLLEPDLKESLGGVRDRQAWSWMRWAFPVIDAEPPPANDLAAVRLALHAANGGASNRLLAEHHEDVAVVLGIEDRAGWEARDVLMKRVAEAGRATDRWIGRLLDEASGHDRPVLPPSGDLLPPGPIDRWPSEVLQAFLAWLRDGDEIERALDERQATLARLLPEWDDVRGRPQRDPYHRYPVDVHLVETVKEVARLLRVQDEPFDAQAVQAITDRDALLLGALLHDIGKVGKGSHVTLGVEVAARVLDRMGLPHGQRDDVLFLVREHLLLSDSATRRNVEDEDLVLRVAARVGTPERLAMLYLLTVADANATGPSACSPWRMRLVRDLVSNVDAMLDGRTIGGRAARLEQAEDRIREALSGRPAQDVEAFLRSVPAAYLQWVRPPDAAVHADLMKGAPEPTEVRSDVRPGRTPGTYLITVVARDRLGLLADIAGSLSVSGLAILGAHAFTSERGVALDEFEVRGAFEPNVSPERWDRFRSILQEAVDGADVGHRLRAIRARYPPPAVTIRPNVRIDQETSQLSTIVEVEGPDRIGLLFDLAKALSELRLDVHLARVATYGPRVVDVFYVTDEAGQKIVEPERLAALERDLAAAVSS